MIIIKVHSNNNDDVSTFKIDGDVLSYVDISKRCNIEELCDAMELATNHVDAKIADILTEYMSHKG